MTVLLVSSGLTAGESGIKDEICSRHCTESLTRRVTDNFLSAFCGNCVTFHECQTDISGQTEAKSTTGFTFVILMIWQQFNQYLWTWASQSKNKRVRVLNCAVIGRQKGSCSFVSELESEFVWVLYQNELRDIVVWIVLRRKMSP